MSRIIEVTVSPRGEATVQTRGYTGGDCLAASRFLEQALGTSTVDCRTADFFHGQPAEQAVRHTH